MQVPAISNSNYFGIINKVRWYSVTEYFNDYNVDLYIYTSRVSSSNVSIENRANTNGAEWTETIPANANQDIVVRQVNLLHVPVIKAQEYVILNKSV